MHSSIPAFQIIVFWPNIVLSSYPNKPYISRKLIYPAFRSINLSLRKNDPYGWFCGPGSHIIVEYVYILIFSIILSLLHLCFPVSPKVTMTENDVDNELLDYEEDEEPQTAVDSAVPAGKKEVKGSYVSIHSSGFRDFLLKPELLRAIVDCGFEHPSEGEDLCDVCL